MPDYDLRVNDAATSARINLLQKSGVMTLRKSARAKLVRRSPGLAIDLNAALATPDFVRSTQSFLTQAVVGPIDARAIVKQYITDHADLFGVTPAQLDAARMARDATTAHNGVRTLWWQQQINGVDVLGSDLRVNILPDGRIVSIGSRMLPETALNTAANKQSLITRSQAVKLAATNIGVDLAGDLNVVEKGATAAQRMVFAKTPQLSRNTTTDLVYFPVAFDDVRPAHRVTIGAVGDSNVYEIIVDATTGDILQRSNNTWYAGPSAGTYRVWTNDSPAPMSPGPDTPTGVQAPIVPRDLVTLDSLDPIASPDGWIQPGLNETLGNNVDSHTDLNNDNAPDLPRPQGSPFHVFDFPADLTMAPSAYRQASVVQGFYTSNKYHDQLYQLGFTEPFANFQNDNFGRGGVGGDPVSLDVHDGGGTNNANWNGTGNDGDFTFVQMFIFDGPNPDRDGNLDAHILIHELTHGTSTRLHGRLSGTQSRSMGEGWSDFYALALTLQPTDNIDGVYALSGFATFDAFGGGFSNNYYFGIRRFPYSSDPLKNPLTFGDINSALFDVDPAIPNSTTFASTNPSEVHNIGEVWCQTLWQCDVTLINKLGFAGNQTMLQLVTDGMKLTTTSAPSFVQSRDAILLADMVNNASANVCDLWGAFASRGLGDLAFSASTSPDNIAESFDIPIGVNFAIDGPAPDQAVANQVTSFPVTISNNCGAPLTPGSARLVLTVNGATQEIPLDPGAGALEFVANIPPLACGDIATYFVAADTTEGTFTFPANGASDPLSLLVLTSTVDTFADDFEQDLGWSVFGDATTGQWERGVPAGDGNRGDPTTDADGSGQAYLTENGPGDTDIDGGTTSLLSPTLDASGSGDAFIQYSIWYVNDGNSNVDDVFTVEISNDDGANFTQLEQLATSTNGWETRLLKISDTIAPTSTMRLRFTAGDLGLGSIVEAGVDGVKITLIACDASANIADLNGDGVVNGADLAILLTQWGTNGPADINNDGVVNGADLAILLTNWSQ